MNMSQMTFKFCKCTNCGHEDFQWVVEIGDEVICHTCIKLIDAKLTDRENDARNKSSDDVEKHKPDKDARIVLMRF